MALENFKPEIFSTLIDTSYRNQLVLGKLAKDLSSKIKVEGKSITLPRLGDVTVKDYAGTIEHEDAKDANTKLVIDKEKYFSVKVDETDLAQAVRNTAQAIEEQGAAGLAFQVEKDLAELVTKAKSTVTVASADEILGGIRKAGALLSKANVPKTGRYLVVSPEVAMMIIEKLPTVSTGDAALKTAIDGYVGKFGGFEIYESNAIKGSEGATHQCMAGGVGAMYFAGQIEKARIMEEASSFNKYFQGLNTYGTAVAETESGKTNRMVNLTVTVESLSALAKAK